MTSLLRRRPRPTARPTRAQLQQRADAYRQQRDRAQGQRRATLDWIASTLAIHADRYAATRSPIRRQVADELRALADTIQHGPR